MHETKWTCIVFILRLCTTIQGSTSLTCTPVYPRPNSVVVCECAHSNGEDIQWFKDNTIISACSATSGFCSPEPLEYTFDSYYTGSIAHYNLTINSYYYSDCGQYTCEDFSSPPKVDDASLSIFDFNASLATQLEEPSSNHSSGSINITTGCFIQKTEVIQNIKLYKIVNGVPMEMRPELLDITEDTSSCEICSGEQALKLIIRYYHEEAIGNDVEEVQFQIFLFHNRNMNDPLNRTTRNYYYIKVSDESNTTGCACDIKNVLISWAVAWGGAIILTVFESCIYRHCCGKLDFCECLFVLTTIPLILVIVVIRLYPNGRKKMILMYSSIVDVAFISTTICICFLTEIRELPDLLWASLIYVIICALSSALKCTITEITKRDRNVPHRNSDVKQNKEKNNKDKLPSKEHDKPGTRKPLPPISSENARLGNDKEHEHSLKTLNPTHGSRLPPISKNEKV